MGRYDTFMGCYKCKSCAASFELVQKHIFPLLGMRLIKGRDTCIYNDNSEVNHLQGNSLFYYRILTDHVIKLIEIEEYT